MPRAPIHFKARQARGVAHGVVHDLEVGNGCVATRVEDVEPE